MFDDFGGFVEPHKRCLLAKGIERIARKEELHNVVIASTDAEVAKWLQPDWLVSFDAAGAATLRHNPPSMPASGGGRRPAAEMTTLRYDEHSFDAGGAAPAVDPVLELARRHGAAATFTSVLMPGPYQPGTREIVSRVTIDAAAVEACEATGLATSDVAQRRKCSTSYVVPPELTDGAWSGVAVVLGDSGSGKTLALMAATAGSSQLPGQTQWSTHESVASIVAGLATLTEPTASHALQLLGLPPSASSRPHAALSAGEQCLADIAHVVAVAGGSDAGDVLAIDEFTSVLDRSAAARACVGLRRLVQLLCAGRHRRVVVATVHADVVPFLKPQLLVLTSHCRLHRLQWSDATPPPPPVWSSGGAEPFAREPLRFVLRTAPDHPKESGYAKGLWKKAFVEHHSTRTRTSTAPPWSTCCGWQRRASWWAWWRRSATLVPPTRKTGRRTRRPRCGASTAWSCCLRGRVSVSGRP